MTEKNEKQAEREAFISEHQYLDLTEARDAWDRVIFKHSHVEAMWKGWMARASTLNVEAMKRINSDHETVPSPELLNDESYRILMAYGDEETKALYRAASPATDRCVMAGLSAIKIHEIAVDGLPNMDEELMIGRVAFIWNGAIVSGWPLTSVGRPDLWESSEDAMGMRPFSGVTHWVEFACPVWNLGCGTPMSATPPAAEGKK